MCDLSSSGFHSMKSSDGLLSFGSMERMSLMGRLRHVTTDRFREA